MQSKSDERKVEFEVGSGNVFADLGLGNPEERRLKAALMRAINREIKNRKLNQSAAADCIGLTQPDVSRISRGQGRAFSVERLLDVLKKLNVDIEITMQHGTGQLLVRELV
ncbi:MAG: helix-turn-helix domain-containing protein [Candidatus Baltobacteraceae bacterium]